MPGKLYPRLKEFVQAPYFNKKQEVALLLNYLLQTAPDFKDELTDKNIVWLAICPDLSYDEKELSYWMSDLLHLIENFIVVEEIDKAPMQKYSILLKQYNQMGLVKHFQATMNSLRKQLEHYPYRDSEYYNLQYLLNYNENVFFERQKEHRYDESLQRTIEFFDHYYLSHKLKYCCEIVNRQSIVNSSYDPLLLKEILNYLNNTPQDLYPPIAVYQTILNCFLHLNDQSYFAKLKDVLSNNTQYFSRMEARDIYLLTANYCVKQINKGVGRFFEELFIIYKEMIELGLIFDAENQISPWSYKNIVEVSIRNKQYQFAEDFIKNYKHYLAPALMNNAYAYNLANLYFQQTRYKEAMKLLQTVSFDDLFYSTESKMLLLRIYYELNEKEPMLSLFESFRMYLRRNKQITDEKRKVYLNFIKFLVRIDKIRRGNTPELAELKKRIDETKNTANAHWLISKIDEKMSKYTNHAKRQ